jgi:hypothetical protein
VKSSSTPDSSAVLIRALIAYSVYEHGYEGGTASLVSVDLKARSCTLEDDGRGIGLHRPGYVAGLVEQLALRQGKVALHGLGLAIVAMSSPSMIVQSRRDGRQFTQRFSWGVAQGEVEREPWSGPTGTRIVVQLADEAPVIDAAAVRAQVELWRAAHPGLRIDMTCESDDAR